MNTMSHNNIGTLLLQMRPFMFPFYEMAPILKITTALPLQATASFVKKEFPNPIIPMQRKIPTLNVTPRLVPDLPTEKKALTIVPKEKDTLFWLFYILHYGWDKYQEPDTTRFANETQEKFHWIEILRQKKKDIKRYVKICATDCENELASEPRIRVPTFLALCSAASLNVLMVKGRTYYQLKTSEEDIDADTIQYHIILLEKGGRYAWDKKADAKQIRSDYIRRVSWDKPMKGISSYTLAEIQELAKRAQMPVDHTKKPIKKDMYEWLLQHL